MPQRSHILLLISLIGSSAATAFAQPKPMPDPLEQNAALAYWQAFAVMPHLTETEQTLRDQVLAGERPLNEEAKQIIGRSENALRAMHRGAKMERVAWAVPWEEGPHAILPHISKARELARFAAFRARSNFEEGKSQEALDDLFAALMMGRHVAKEGVIVLIPLLVDYAIEATCLHVLAEYSPQVDAKTRAELKRRLAELPASRSLTDAVQGEKDVFHTWLIEEVKKPNPKDRVLEFVGKVPEEQIEAFKKLQESELLPATRRMGEYYDRMIADVKLPPDEVQKRYERLNQDIKNNGAKDLLSQWLFPWLHAGRKSEATHLTRLALIEAGLAVLKEGEDALKDPALKDPFGDGPFAYKETDSGFVLTSDWELAPDKKLSLTFGK
jgi:hypothetical protein